MKIALIADIHANLEALQACLHHAGAMHAERYAFLGDLVGYGADPGAVVDIISDQMSHGAIAVLGNHDQAVAKGTRDLNEVAQEAIEWTRNRLNEAQREFLGRLPVTVRDGELYFVHASALNPEKWEYIDSNTSARLSIEAAGTNYVFSGHVHDPTLYFMTQVGKIAPFRPISGSPVPVPSHRRWLAIAGSAGQPRDGNPAASYALFDSATEQITFFRIPYDHAAAAQKIRRAGLPEWLAQRIERGE